MSVRFPYQRDLQTPDENAAASEGNAYSGFPFAEKDLQDRAVEVQLGDMDDNGLKGLAASYAKRVYGNMPKEVQIDRAQAELDRLRATKQKIVPANKAALANAIEHGANETPETLYPSQEQFQAQTSGKTWNKTRPQVLNDLVKEGKLDILTSRKYWGSAPDDVEQEIAARMAQPQSQPMEFHSKLEGVLDKAQRPARLLSGATAGALATLRDNKLAKNGQSESYIDNMLKYAKEAATGPANSPYQLDSVLQKMQDDTKREALRQAREIHKDDPQNKEAIVATAQQIYDAQEQFLDPVAHPSGARLAHELLFDPLMAVPGEKLSELAGKGLKAVVPESLQKATQFAPALAEAGEVGSIGRLAADQAQVGQHVAISEMDRLLGKMQSVSKVDRDLLAQVLDGKVSPTELPKRLQKPYAAGKQLAETHRNFLQETGLGNRWEADTLQELKPVESYLPHRKFEELGAAELEDVAGELNNPNALAKVEVASSKIRTGTGKGLVKDPVVQWETELRNLKKEARLAGEIKRGRSMLEEQGLWKTVPKADAKEAMTKAAQEWGGEVVELPPNLDQRVQRISGVPGVTKLNETATIVPRAIYSQYMDLLKVSRSPNKTAGIISDVNKAVLQPLTRVWKATNTLSPVFLFNNVVGNFTSGYLAQGLKHFNPKVVTASAGTVLLDALKQAEKVTVPFTLRSGKTQALGDLVKMAKADGHLGQLDFRLGYETERTMQNPVSRGFNKVADVLQNSPPVKAARVLNQLGDDYHRFNIWLSVLEDVTPAGRAAAADKVAKLAGNFRRLGDGEKFMREFIPYYSWLRHITPFVAQQVVENPKRMADFAKFRGFASREDNKFMPTNQHGVADYLQDFAVVAPESRQPKALVEAIRTGQLPAPGSHAAAMMVMQDPITMGLWYVPIIEQLTGISGKEHPETIANLMGPFVQLGLELITGTDLRTGQLLEEGAVPRLKHIAKTPVARPLHEWGSLLQTYPEIYGGRAPENLDLYMRYATGRYFYGLDNWIAEEMGHEGRSVASYPGGALYLNNPITTGLKRKSAAVKHIPAVERTLQE